MKPRECYYYGLKQLYPNQMENVETIFPNEIFTPVIYYDLNVLPYYYISNYGRLYSVRYKRIMSLYKDESGYYRVNIFLSTGNHVFTGIHKLELMSFRPIVETDLFISNHKDGDKINNYIDNLEWMTISENTRHALDTGLANYKCENNPRSYITNDDVHFICSLLEKSYSTGKILNLMGYEYGIERNRMGAIIRNIRKGDTYTDISKNYNIPGIKGVRRYDPEMTEKVYKLMTDGNKYRIDEFCDILGIELEDRKMFKNYIGDIMLNKVHKHITEQYPNKVRPYNVDKDDIYYDYYN